MTKMKVHLVRIYFGLQAHLLFYFLVEGMHLLQRISLCGVGERTHLEQLFMKCSWYCPTAQVNCRQHCLLCGVQGHTISVKAFLFLTRLKYLPREFSWQRSLCLKVVCLISKTEETALLEKVLHKVSGAVMGLLLKYNLILLPSRETRQLQAIAKVKNKGKCL